jgi:glycine cleavage system H lipoate-binding protein
MELIQTKQTTAPLCLWMQAGVVKKKYCHTDFSCATCRFDRALNRVCRQNQLLWDQGKTPSGKKAKVVFWKNRLKTLPPAQRPCIHHMKGKISFKACPRAYHCVDCEFDQYFYDHFKVHAMIQPMDYQTVHGLAVPAGYYLSAWHLWVKIEDQGMVRMGIDDFGARLLGKIDTIHTPLMGKRLHQGQPGFTLFKERYPIVFSSAVTGIITRVNPEVQKHPNLVTTAPYTDGWIFLVHCQNLKNDLKQLLFMEEGVHFMAGQAKMLSAFLEDATQMKAADGGTLIKDILGNIPKAHQDRLIQTFITPGP